MSLLGGRGGRPDDWETQHARARARAAERLAAPLDPGEEAWLDDHLDACADCSAVVDEYATQRLQLRALRDRQPPPPRDLWARTAAAIERESGGRRRPRRRARLLIAPYAVLVGALVVAVVYGSLSAPWSPPGPAMTSPAATAAIAAASTLPSAGPTPLAVAPRDVAYLTRDGGDYQLNTTRIDEVCPAEAGSCAASEPNEIVEIGPLSSPATVFGADSRPLVIVADDGAGSSVTVLSLAADAPSATPATTPTGSEEPTISPPASESPSTPPSGSVEPSLDPTDPSQPPDPTPPPPTQPVDPSASVGQESIEIAEGLSVVDTTAAYAPDGSAFAFTARLADGSLGPDIYVWRVGEDTARPVTNDHRSVFGSWAGDAIVGSTVEDADGVSEPRAFVIDDPAGEPSLRPELGLVWRPVVDPTGGSAVYWSGTLDPTDGPGWSPGEGRLVIGRWSDDATAGDVEPTPLTGDQDEERSETTIAEGPLTDWDVRWDETGERLAVWIADPENPGVGRLSLYVVDPFDGRIDLTSPPLLNEPALAGFSIDSGRLAWASPGDSTDASSRVLVLAWTPDGVGQVESATGDFILVR